MIDTYPSQAAYDEDRALLEILREAINAAKVSVRLDVARLWVIQGRGESYISTWGDGKTWSAYLSFPNRALQWSWAKKGLAKGGFCEVTQDGDDDGVLRILRLPNPEEAETLRRYVGVRQTVDNSAKAGTFRPRIVEEGSPGTWEPPSD